MSYCRFDDDSDVYMYSNMDGTIDCCACLLGGGRYTQKEALAHLEEHRWASHLVPQHAIDRLKREIAEGGGNDE